MPHDSDRLKSTKHISIPPSLKGYNLETIFTTPLSEIDTNKKVSSDDISSLWHKVDQLQGDIRKLTSLLTHVLGDHVLIKGQWVSVKEEFK